MIWLLVALVVVLAAAALLTWILLEAKGIAKEAKRALVAAATVEKNTAALWAIPQVNGLLKEGDGVMKAIVNKASAVAEAVDPRGATR